MENRWMEFSLGAAGIEVGAGGRLARLHPLENGDSVMEGTNTWGYRQ